MAASDVLYLPPASSLFPKVNLSSEIILLIIETIYIYVYLSKQNPFSFEAPLGTFSINLKDIFVLFLVERNRQAPDA